MSTNSHEPVNRRILIIDDNRAIHDDFRKILLPTRQVNSALSAMEDALFGDSDVEVEKDHFEISSAYQGKEAFDTVVAAAAEGRPFAMAFVDVRMPPGWDGVETISRMWERTPELHVVICSAYSDYSWEQIIEKLGKSDRLLILRKPFDPVEVQQLASNLTEKWSRLNSNTRTL
jgi:two-component system, NtrC family, sensor kinase